jgi:hydrogenase nickel incorporation protein HypA/HybF
MVIWMSHQIPDNDMPMQVNIFLINITFRDPNPMHMHEFAIAVDIVDIAVSAARQEGATRVKEVEIEIGQLSGVVMEALEFSLEAAVKGTLLEHARRNLVTVPGRARCTQCGREYDTDTLYQACPACQAMAPEIIQGRELRVKSLIVE